MRNAPSVSYPVGRCPFYAGLLTGLGLLGLVVLGLSWVFVLQGSGIAGLSNADWWRGVAGAILWSLWLGFAWRSWSHAPVGRLQWDARATASDGTPRAGLWIWQSQAYQQGAPLKRVETLLDLQSRMLLQGIRADGAGMWIWAEQGRDPAQWKGLRRALLACGR